MRRQPRIGGRRARHFGVKIYIKHPVFVIADFDDFVVAQSVGMAVCRDAPYVERVKLAIAIDGDKDGSETAALGAKDLDDAPLQEGGLAIRLDGEGLLVVQRHRHGGFGVVRRRGVCCGEHPVRRLGSPTERGKR